MEHCCNETYLGNTLITTKLTRTDLGSNPNLRAERSVTDRLSKERSRQMNKINNEHYIHTHVHTRKFIEAHYIK